jgi:hypothetical protein
LGLCNGVIFKKIYVKKILEDVDIYSMYYVYEHYKKDTDRIFYVGIGKIEKGKYQRADSHIKRNPHWHATVKKYGFDSKIVFESESREEVCNKEIELILKHGRKDLGTGPLVNKTTGGEKTFEMSIDSIKRGVSKKKENGTYSKCAEIARQRMLTNNPWKGKTHDGLNKREVYQYEASTGVFVEKYKSIKSATSAMGFSSDNVIGKCLRGENQTGGGYIWYYRFMGEKVSRIRKGIAKDQLKRVIEVDQLENIINEWECISDAALAAGVTPSAVGQAIRKNSLCKGRKFKIKA